MKRLKLAFVLFVITLQFARAQVGYVQNIQSGIKRMQSFVRGVPLRYVIKNDFKDSSYCILSSDLLRKPIRLDSSAFNRFSISRWWFGYCRNSNLAFRTSVDSIREVDLGIPEAGIHYISTIGRSKKDSITSYSTAFIYVSAGDSTFRSRFPLDSGYYSAIDSTVKIDSAFSDLDSLSSTQSFISFDKFIDSNYKNVGRHDFVIAYFKSDSLSNLFLIADTNKMDSTYCDMIRDYIKILKNPRAGYSRYFKSKFTKIAPIRDNLFVENRLVQLIGLTEEQSNKDGSYLKVLYDYQKVGIYYIVVRIRPLKN